MVNRISYRYHPLMSLIEQCGAMRELKRIHAQIITSGLSKDAPLVSKILFFSAISDSGDINYSSKLFFQMPSPSILNWNIIIRGYSKSKNPNRAISLYAQLLHSGVSPDHLTYPFLVKSCARLSAHRLGASVHCHISRSGIESDKFVQNSLVHMYSACGDVVSARKLFDEILLPGVVSWNSIVDGYAKCGDMASARELFDLMPERDVVSWSALIDGYVKDGNYREALAIFEMMQIEGPKANDVTMVSVLCACSHLGALEQGRKMHQYVVLNGLQLRLALKTSLIDMYSKCGSIKEAARVFRGASLDQTDVLTWNAMISGFAAHGLCRDSLDLFGEMQCRGIVPDEITYLGLLSACAHGGLVQDAWHFFKSLDEHGMAPRTEHYACMVDVLSRAGRLHEALEFMDTMPVEPTASMLGALLTGCNNHGEVELGERIGQRLIRLEPDHDGRYIGLSNVYAVANRWDEARRMRENMEKRRVKKAAGCSIVEVDGVLHRFIAHDKKHLLSVQVYAVLKDISMQMKLEDSNDRQKLDYFDAWEGG
ncbi:pentatricopeptide repeat-containing protein At5g08305 [Aristolochia californica]|uniref:pentatricopeptide repeat-containing protein At5g08305 n=1 Tax=Aristolochia californica TaxID=171875 RepID=UPI0035DDDCC3